ncbi:hypothetical protein [Mycobacterium sp. pR1184]|uniref:hypothetical protein n=1 Tax=Mycobacterium sp. pR1184 TaxID=3238981 RepID=UPI00351B4C4C
MDDVVQAMLDQLNAGFPRVETMTGAQARASVGFMTISSFGPATSVQDLVFADLRGLLHPAYRGGST